MVDQNAYMNGREAEWNENQIIFYSFIPITPSGTSPVYCLYYFNYRLLGIHVGPNVLYLIFVHQQQVENILSDHTVRSIKLTNWNNSMTDIVVRSSSETIASEIFCRNYGACVSLIETGIQVLFVRGAQMDNFLAICVHIPKISFEQYVQSPELSSYI